MSGVGRSTEFAVAQKNARRADPFPTLPSLHIAEVREEPSLRALARHWWGAMLGWFGLQRKTAATSWRFYARHRRTHPRTLGSGVQYVPDRETP